MVLSDIAYDNNNRVTQAKVAKMTYFLKNQEVYDKSKGRNVSKLSFSRNGYLNST